MTLFNYSEIGNVQIDENFDNDNYSWQVDDALEYGYNEDFPIVVDEDVLIIDGNHRFVAFQNEERLDDVFFCRVNYNDFIKLQGIMIDQDSFDRFNKDDEFFYDQIKTIAI